MNYCEKYFLGSNTNEGFYSLFDQLYDPEGDMKVYILKGGPGCGKSTLMGKIADIAEKFGHHVECIMCASDPESYDAILIKDCGIAMVDGTSPHVIEPKYYGACEEIINLGSALNSSKLQEKAAEIKYLFHKNSSCYKKTTNYLKASAALIRNNKRLQDEYVNYEKLYNYVIHFATRELGLSDGLGDISYRFFTAITNEGAVEFSLKNCNRIIAIDDPIGTVSGQILDCLLTIADDCGINAIAGVSPFDTEEIIHVVFPDQKIAIVRKMPGTIANRTIHASRFLIGDGVKTHKAKIAFNKKASAELNRAAISSLKEAKKIHDEIEEIYISAIDYSVLTKKTDAIIDKIIPKLK